MHVNNPSAEVFLKDGSLNAGSDDSAFLQSLRRSLKTSRGAYPPVALAEIYREYKLPLTKIRRLHLMVVDLDRSRSVSTCMHQNFKKCHIPTVLIWLAASTLFLSLSQERIALSKCDLSLPMGWTIQTNPVTCCGPTEELVDNSCFFFLIAGCIGSLGYWQSLATRE